jgi:glycerate kinase
VSRPVVLGIAQAFKESFTADAVARAYERAIRDAGGEPRVLRASDGGDGLLEALTPVITHWTSHDVADPLLRPVTVRVGWMGSEAIIESRLAVGLSVLSPDERDPLRTSTRGVGLLIARAAEAGAERVYVGLGGSATMDGGMGMARTWGVVPHAADGRELDEGGGALVDLARLDRGQPPEVDVVGLCDVSNPLLGERGARVFARQKGATADAEAALDRGLERLVRVLGAEDAAAEPGAGAAGGLGFGLRLFAGGRLVPGASWVLERLGFEAAVGAASAVLVGEGRFDRTSLEGKLSGVVLARARAQGVAHVLIAPRAEHVPEDTIVESGGAPWDLAELERRAYRAVSHALGLLGA